jgi:two-component system, chemotaxis family, sensor kinase CheA
MTSGRDPYKYFRIEARELLDGLSQGVLELEKGPPGKDLVARLLRLAHTLKGASRVVKLGQIAEHAHALEGLLTPYRTSQSAPERDQIDAVLKLLDEIGLRLSAIDPAKDIAPDRDPSGASEEPFETVRVELDEMDGLVEGVSEASIRVHALQRHRDEVERVRQLVDTLVDQLDPKMPHSSAARARQTAGNLRESLQRLERDLGTGVEQVATELAQIRDAANRLRLLPASNVFALLERAARDAGTSMQKAIDFQASGGATRLDAHVLGALRDALMHLVRNAVVHGIEHESERIARGKPRAGRIQVTVERRGNRVAFTCSDDGGGIDVFALGQAAVREGLLPAQASASLTSQDAFRLLLKGGLTTSRTVTDLSGRGIGLDVVRETAARLKGDVSVQSEADKGTRFEIIVPMSLSSLPALIVDAAGASAAVPFDAVRATMRASGAEIARSAEGEAIVHQGQVIPFVPLRLMLDASDSAPQRDEAWSVVIVQAGGATAAIGVDRIGGIANTLVRPLVGHAEADPIVAGAALDAEGNPQLVLDPTALVAAAHRARETPRDAVTPKDPVLVVDDSLTTRMLEQSILEAAGYDVDLATSAEEALGKARHKRYGLFLVDVEMPGMDGFEFVAQTRSDPILREIPAILVTSRASTDDRNRGKQVGARAYIAKGEFDQAFLLRTIRDLVR